MDAYKQESTVECINGDPDVMVGMLPNDKFSPASLSSTPTCSASTVSTTSLISMIATSASETVDQLSISTQSAKAASTSINDIMPSTSANVDNDSRTKQQEDTDNSEKLALIVCARCEQPIRDKYVYRVLEQNYHQNCLRCVDCQASFSNTCFSRHGNIYCRKHFLRRYGPKCSGCFEIINEQSTVRRANNHIYHVECFQCLICKKQFSTGDQFYLIPVDGRLVCRNDFENFASKENEMDCGNKRPRTTISAKSLEILKHAYQNSSKPPRHIREQLASQTGLDMRVVQVWFQNRRAKEKRLKKDAGRRWTSNNIANCINEDGVNIGMANDSLFGDGHEVNIRGLDSDSASNDGSLAGRSPLYGAGGYMDTSSDLDIRSELSYGDSTSSGAVVINGCMPNNDSMLATAASTSMNSSLIHGIPMHGQLTNGGSLNTSLYVDVHSISAAGSNPSAVTPICLADQEETSSVATTVIAPYLLNNNSATSLLSNNLLHDVHLQHQQQKQSPISHQHHQPLQDHQQQFAAAAAAVAAAAAAAHQRHEQHQLEQLHQLQQQHHHQLLVMQHRQHYMDQQSGVLHSHHALSPFSGHHAIQVSAPLPATDSLLAYTQQ